MRVISTKSKNAESFYISKGYVNDKGVSTSVIVRKLGTLEDLLKEHGPTRDDVMVWAKEEARIETLKYKEEKRSKAVQIIFRADKELEYEKQKFYRGGYLFLQTIYYELKLDKVCRKLRYKYKNVFDKDINAILSDLIYARVLDPYSSQPSYNIINSFLEKPLYQPTDIHDALEILGKESDYIQSEVYKNSPLLKKKSEEMLYYDCMDCYFDIKEEVGKGCQPNTVIQMCLLMNSEGLPLRFSLCSKNDEGHTNNGERQTNNDQGQTNLRQQAKEIFKDFEGGKLVYCGGTRVRAEQTSYIIIKPVKEITDEYREWAVNKRGFKGVSDNMLVNFCDVLPDDKNVYYKEEPYTLEKPNQRLIIVYSPKYALHRKAIRERLVNHSEENEAEYDGLYVVYTDLIYEDTENIIKLSEKRWQTEEYFRIVKTDFSTRLDCLQNENCIKGHFLICFLALLSYRILEKKLNYKYTSDEILDTLNSMNFAGIGEQGFIPLYKRKKIVDDLHEACGFHSDFQFITKSGMKTIQKNSKGKSKPQRANQSK